MCALCREGIGLSHAALRRPRLRAATGGRFQVRETLKFLEGSEYQISLKVNPGLKIE